MSDTSSGIVTEIQHISHALCVFFISKVRALFSNPNIEGEKVKLRETAPRKYNNVLFVSFTC